MTEYRSNYEFICKDCGQPIKPLTPYHVRKRRENFRGKRITEFDRTHVECPEQASKAESAFTSDDSKLNAANRR